MNNMAEAIVNIDNISFSYGKGDILKNVSSAIYEVFSEL